MTQASIDQPGKRTAYLFIGHLLNDGFGAFLAPLLPLLIQRLDLSLAMAGLLGTVRILMNSLLQPSLGHLVDRVQRPWLVIIGPLLSVTAMSLIGRANSYWLLLLVMAIAGVGTALFHPAAAALVAAGTHSRRGLMMAFFSSGGTLGGAAAPIVIVAFTQTFDLGGTPWLLIPGLALVAAFAFPLMRVLPHSIRQAHERFQLGHLPGRFVVLWTVLVIRSVSATAFASFLAVLVVERGGSAWAGAVSISAFLLAGAAGSFLAGNLSDRWGRKAVILGSMVMATPLYFLFLHGPATFLLPVIAVAGLFDLSATPVGVVAAQECIPGRTGLVSGLVMGLAWGVGGIALYPIGWLADQYGIITVMSCVAMLPLVGAGLMSLYREA
ncbi:MFS transporter [Candidatus Bipolaricaulota bacterium]|nr:MFS transporter [Candidatus Bipolaricaulota bacterium]TFH11640.1 MAG: MFS transporter [Candidatus Atribacteria bacterium]